MKLLTIIFATILTITAYSQHIDTNNKRIVSELNRTETDSVPEVLYIDHSWGVPKNNSEHTPAYYLDGQLMNSAMLNVLTPDCIQELNVVKKDTVIGGKKYFGQVFIKTKQNCEQNYKPKLISLNALKLKYTRISNTPFVFMINNDLINDNYDDHMIDEKYVLQIIVEKFDREEQNLNLTVIKILTRTKENIKKSKEIWIRGLIGQG